jgi:hypothetical protein
MKRKVAPTVTTAVRGSTTLSARILDSIKDQEPDDLGRYAGWGGGEDLKARPQRDQLGPSILPRNWGRTLGLLWIPAIIVLVTVELWLGLPQVAGWISLVGLFVVFLLVQFWLDRKGD